MRRPNAPFFCASNSKLKPQFIHRVKTLKEMRSESDKYIEESKKFQELIKEAEKFMDRPARFHRRIRLGTRGRRIFNSTKNLPNVFLRKAAHFGFNPE